MSAIRWFIGFESSIKNDYPILWDRWKCVQRERKRERKIMIARLYTHRCRGPVDTSPDCGSPGSRFKSIHVFGKTLFFFTFSTVHTSLECIPCSVRTLMWFDRDVAGIVPRKRDLQTGSGRHWSTNFSHWPVNKHKSLLDMSWFLLLQIMPFMKKSVFIKKSSCNWKF